LKDNALRIGNPKNKEPGHDGPGSSDLQVAV
jgi:hypothetical protein